MYLMFYGCFYVPREQCILQNFAYETNHMHQEQLRKCSSYSLYMFSQNFSNAKFFLKKWYIIGPLHTRAIWYLPCNLRDIHLKINLLYTRTDWCFDKKYLLCFVFCFAHSIFLYKMALLEITVILVQSYRFV